MLWLADEVAWLVLADDATLDDAWLATDEEAWLATDLGAALDALVTLALAVLVAWLAAADCGAALVAVVVEVPFTSSLSPTKIKLTLANLLAFSIAETVVLWASAISETVSPALTVTVSALATVVERANKAKAAVEDKTRFLIFIM